MGLANHQGKEARWLLQEMEFLRERLHIFVGGEYRPERLQEARELSLRLDELVVQYTKLLADQEPQRKRSE